MRRLIRGAPWAVAGALLALDLAAMLLLASRLDGITSIDNAIEIWFDQDDHTTINAYCLEQVEFGRDPLMMVNVWARDGRPTALRRLSQDLTEALLDIEGVDDVRPTHGFDTLEGADSPLPAPADVLYRNLNTKLDGSERWAQHPTLLSFLIREGRPAHAGDSWRQELVRAIRARLNARDDLVPASAADEAGLAGEQPFAVVGTAVINADLNNLSWRDFRLLIPVSSVVVVLLVFALLRIGWRFGAAVAVSGSLATVGLCSAMMVFGRPFNMLTIGLPGVVFTLSVASGLHVLHHYCERLAQRGAPPPADCGRLTTWNQLRPIAVSHFTTALGFGLQITVPVLPVTTMAFWGALGVLWAGLHSAFLTPQLLALAGRPRALAQPTFRGTETVTAAAQALAARCAAWRRRRGPVALILVALAVPTVVGILSLDVNSTYLNMVGDDEAMRRDYAHLDAKKLASTQLTVIIHRPMAASAPDRPVLNALRSVAHELHAARIGICRAGLGLPTDATEETDARLQTAWETVQAGAFDYREYRVARELRLARDRIARRDLSPGGVDNLLENVQETVQSLIGERTAVVDAAFADALRAARERIEGLDAVAKVIGPDQMLEFALAAAGPVRVPDDRAITLAYAAIVDGFPEARGYIHESLERYRLLVTFEYLDNRALRALISEVNRHLSDAFAEVHGLTYAVSGVQVLWANMDRAIERTFWSNIARFAVVCFVVFFLSTRRFRLAAIATTVNVLPMATIAAIMGFAGMPLDLATIFILGLTFGIAIDDTSFFLHRYVHSGGAVDPLAALRGTLRTTVPPMLVTSMVIAAGFSVLLLSSFTPMQVFGSFTALGIVLATLFDGGLLPLLILAFAVRTRRRAD